MVEVVYAQNYSTSGSLFSSNMEFGDFILLVISLFVLIGLVLSIIFILWGGLLLILSGGKDDKIKPAINTIRYAVFGIILTVATIFIFPIFASLLGLDVERYAEPERIFEKIEEIGVSIFGNGSGSNYNIDGIDSIDQIPADFSEL